MEIFGHIKSKNLGSEQLCLWWIWVHGLLHPTYAPHPTMCIYMLRLGTSVGQQITHPVTPFSLQQHECIKRALHWLLYDGFDTFVPRRQSWACSDLSKSGQSCLSVALPGCRYLWVFGIVLRTAQAQLIMPWVHTNSLCKSIQKIKAWELLASMKNWTYS